MEIIAYLYSKDINKCFDYSYSKINNGVFSDISAIQAHYDFMIKEKDLIVFSDKKVIPA